MSDWNLTLKFELFYKNKKAICTLITFNRASDKLRSFVLLLFHSVMFSDDFSRMLYVYYVDYRDLFDRLQCGLNVLRYLMCMWMQRVHSCFFHCYVQTKVSSFSICVYVYISQKLKFQTFFSFRVPSFIHVDRNRPTRSSHLTFFPITTIFASKTAIAFICSNAFI